MSKTINSLPFLEWLDMRAQRIEQENKAEHLARMCKIVRNAHYYDGNQAGYESPVTGLWQVIPKPDDLKINNVIRDIVKRVAKEWARSKTKLNVRAWADTEEFVGAARQADKIISFYQETLMSATKLQREGKFAQLTGEYYRYCYYDSNAGQLVQRNRYKKKTVKVGEDISTCLNCYFAGKPSDFANGCPECASKDSSIEAAPSLEISIEDGQEFVPQGDIVLEIVDPAEMKADLRSRSLLESVYLRRKRSLRIEILEALFPEFEGDFFTGESDQVLNWLRAIETSAGNAASRHQSGTASQSYTAEFTQVWLDRVLYSNYVVPEDVTVAKVSLKAGTRLIEEFPHGLYFAMVADKVVDIRDENKNDHWSHGVNDLVPGRLPGDGIDDLIELQDLINDLYSLYFSHLMYNSSPPLLADGRRIKREELINRPGMVSFVHLQPGDNLDGAVSQIPPVPLTGQMDMFLDRLQRDALEHGGAFSVQAGAADVDNKTATGAQLIHQAAQALLGLQLEIRAEVDVRTFTQVLRLAQKHWSGKRYLPLMGRKGKKEGEWFRSADIPSSFVLTAQNNSWMPRSEAEKREDLIAVLQALGIPLGPWNPTCPKELRDLCLELFNLDGESDNLIIDEQVAKSKLDKILMATEVGVEVGLEIDAIAAFVSSQVPISIFVDNPDVQIEMISDWLKSDDADKADLVTINILHARIQQLLQVKLQMQQLQMLLQTQAQAA